MAHYRVGDESYDMDPTTWPNVDVAAVQRALGCGLSKFMERLEDIDVDAVQALIWVLRRRSEPGLRIADVTFTVREYLAAIETTDDDVKESWPLLDDQQKAALLAGLPEDQKARLFMDGVLIKEPPVPFDAAGSAATET